MNGSAANNRARESSTRSDGGDSGLIAALRNLLRPRSGGETLRDTLEELIEQEDAAETENAEELAIFRNVLRLRDLTLYDVMVPRADIVAVEIETPLADVVKLMSKTAHSRLPVYKRNLDDVIGMVHIKDVLACWDDPDQSRIRKILLKPLFCAPSMPVLELLLQMRAQRTHMALVVDEFGGIDGLVTIEDIVEEIVGEIEDEHDEESESGFLRRANGAIDIDARMEIEDFEREVGPFLTDEERGEDIDTMGGMVFYLAGRVPARGEVIRHESGLEFEVLDADPRRIRRIRVLNVSHPETE